MTFGSFEGICKKTPLPLCSVVGSEDANKYFGRGIVPDCYARSVELANTMIFQIGTAFVHIGSLAVILMIIYNVRSKYTAIGRSEMLSFFYLAIGFIISSLVVDCGVSAPYSSSYPYFVALQLALAGASCMCLLYNGLLYFQYWEDGSRVSMWVVRILSTCWFIVNFFVAAATFNNWGSLNNKDTTALFVVSYIMNAILLALYVLSQAILSIFALRLLWSFGALCLGVFFFVAGQVLTYAVSYIICTRVNHYIDGLFFGSLCNIFTLMMIYKYWDMITTDDLEFSVATGEHGINTFGGDDEKRNSTFFY